MESLWPLDPARRPRHGSRGCADGPGALTDPVELSLPRAALRARLSRLVPLVCLLATALAIPAAGVAQTAPREPSAPQTSVDQQAQSLAATQRWDALVRLLGPIRPRSATLELDYGIALAHLGSLTQARAVLLAGRRLAPDDPRFSVELAGVAFRQKRYATAETCLRAALRLAPGDAYANDFLATLYFIQGNLEAALKYWNRVGEPRVTSVLNQPEPLVSPALLDHAFAFAPASELTLPQLLTTEARVDALGVFPRFHFELVSRPSGTFDMVFRNQERDGFGGSALESILLTLRGLPFLEVNPSYTNLRRKAINFDSMFRWDAQKRRIWLESSGPLFHAAAYRWSFTTDLRNENWALRNSFTGYAPVLAWFNLRDESAAFQFAGYPSGRFMWSAAATLSRRNYRSVHPGDLLTPQILAPGYQLSQTTGFIDTLLRAPEHRFTLVAGAASEVARLWSPTPQSFEKLSGSLAWNWLPRSRDNDYATRQQFRAGRTFGHPPFDELFILGLERDNDLPMRAHIGTRGGIKGSAPLGRDYLLENWDLDKNLYTNGLFAV